jgi:hypothetical protein
MMGLIYAIDSTDENNGVVHLIGTEYTYNVIDKNGNYIGLYSGYNPRKANA